MAWDRGGRQLEPEVLPAGSRSCAAPGASMRRPARTAFGNLFDPTGKANVSLPTMVERPTAAWRANVEEDVAGLAAGTLDPDEAVAAQLWPDDMIRDTDEVLDLFETDVAGLVNHRYEPAGDAEIFGVIERTVRALNAVNVRYDEAAYETGERESLCKYIEDVLDVAGIDVDAFAGAGAGAASSSAAEGNHGLSSTGSVG
ncbi:hypothetical protein [Dactylosporangium darangshiense]|uniref:Uncharacterized protein n=1 Tax=Dactylosporangium darangshiense TaxID=579108 RepID=A0ABP8DNY6_9ACTN